VDGEPFRVEPLEPLTDDTGLLPEQFVTYDGSQGPAKPGDARGAYAQGAQNVVGKIKDAITSD
jgi:Mn-containing catalase